MRGQRFDVEDGMPKFVIERNVEGVERLSDEAICQLAAKSNGVLHEMGPQIQWAQSYVTEGKIYCVYIAPDEATIREHAKRGGFPADRVARVVRIIDPTTGEPPTGEGQP